MAEIQAAGLCTRSGSLGGWKRGFEWLFMVPRINFGNDIVLRDRCGLVCDEQRLPATSRQCEPHLPARHGEARAVGKAGKNLDEPFAGCFTSAMHGVARRMGRLAGNASIDAKVASTAKEAGSPLEPSDNSVCSAVHGSIDVRLATAV